MFILSLTFLADQGNGIQMARRSTGILHMHHWALWLSCIWSNDVNMFFMQHNDKSAQLIWWPSRWIGRFNSTQL